MFSSSFSVGLEILFKVTVVLAAAPVVNLLLWRASAALRHLVWVLAFSSLLLLLAIEALLPAWQAPMPAGGPASISAELTTARVRAVSIPDRPSPGPWRERAASMTLAVWMAGMLVSLARWRNAAGPVERLRRNAAPFAGQDTFILTRELAGLVGLRAPVNILASEEEIMPMAAGLFQPAILLPGNASRWPRERLRVVLMHEMAHIRRFDGATQALAELAFCFYWFHPLVWLAMHRLHVERERACDDVVLISGNKASDYAAHLLDLARSLQAPARIDSHGYPLCMPARGRAGSSAGGNASASRRPANGFRRGL